jgi:hypothetical protein
MRGLAVLALLAVASGDGRALPTLDALQRILGTACIQPGTIEGARTLLVGSVQWTGNAFRINLRTVDVETGVVTATSSSTGQGGAGELASALSAAMGAFVRG